MIKMRMYQQSQVCFQTIYLLRVTCFGTFHKPVIGHKQNKMRKNNQFYTRATLSQNLTNISVVNLVMQFFLFYISRRWAKVKTFIYISREYINTSGIFGAAISSKVMSLSLETSFIIICIGNEESRVEGSEKRCDLQSTLLRRRVCLKNKNINLIPK